ncbi:MAG: hypothetical protein LUC99_09040 [Clostridiales bacterium]|nr:hypothetical protein [Clostridiales bacterium]
MALAIVVFKLCPMAVVSLFGSESELYNEFAVMCMRIFLMLVVANGLQYCTSIFFQSVGKPVLASVNTFSKQIFLVPLAMMLLSHFMGVTDVLWAGPLTDGLACLISIVLLRGNWNTIFPVETAKNS